MRIKEVKGRWILDSRGNPTVEAEVVTSNGSFRASVPSGASTGKHESLELRDNNKAFHGKGVEKAIANIKKISKKISGMDCGKQEEIDMIMIELDGTKNKSNLGANAILAVSLAVARAGSEEELFDHISKLAKRKTVVPIPFCNIINGGRHADNKLSIQEFMIAPHKASTFKEGIRIVSEIYHELKAELKKSGNHVNVGDEGGFAPQNVSTAREALDFVENSVNELGYSKKVALAVDAAASEFFSKGKYCIDEKKLSNHDLVDYYSSLVKDYNIISLEDPFSEDDFDGFAMIIKKLGGKIQVVGDDLTVTSPERIERALKEKAINALLLKVNQIGTLTEALEAANIMFSKNMKVMASHRSGETEDSFLADLAVGIGCSQIKAGAPCRSERLAKYNRLLRIEKKGLGYARF